MHRAVLLLNHGCVCSQLTNFNLFFFFIVALGSALTQLFRLAAGASAHMKVIPAENDSLQFQHPCTCEDVVNGRTVLLGLSCAKNSTF